MEKTVTVPTHGLPSSSDSAANPREQHEKQGVRRSSIPPPGPPPTGIMGFFNRLGNIPEWTVGGQHLRGGPLNYCIGFIASCGFLMFGYDQGVLSALLTLDSFQKNIKLMTPQDQSHDLCWLDNPDNTIPNPDECLGDAITQAAAVAIYQIGWFLGALLILFYGESWGRKSSTFWGSLPYHDHRHRVPGGRPRVWRFCRWPCRWWHR